MKIKSELTDESILKELGNRLASVRLARNLTQAALADQAGISKRTLERLEYGAVATQLSGLLRVCRILGLMENFDSSNYRWRQWRSSSAGWFSTLWPEIRMIM